MVGKRRLALVCALGIVWMGCCGCSDEPTAPSGPKPEQARSERSEPPEPTESESHEIYVGMDGKRASRLCKAHGGRSGTVPGLLSNRYFFYDDPHTVGSSYGVAPFVFPNNTGIVLKIRTDVSGVRRPSIKQVLVAIHVGPAGGGLEDDAWPNAGKKVERLDLSKMSAPASEQ
jgi:hypothetical protein